MKLIQEPTKKEFEERYNTKISDEAFEFMKKFYWEICLAKDTKQFWKDLDNKQVDIQALVNHCEKVTK